VAAQDDGRVSLMDCKLARRVASLAIIRPRLSLALLILRQSACVRSVMVVRAERHHVLDAEMVLDRVRHDVVVLDDWIAADATPETRLLSQCSLDGGGRRRTAV
jgi:hypothetical protein